MPTHQDRIATALERLATAQEANLKLNAEETAARIRQVEQLQGFMETMRAHLEAADVRAAEAESRADARMTRLERLNGMEPGPDLSVVLDFPDVAPTPSVPTTFMFISALHDGRRSFRDVAGVELVQRPGGEWLARHPNSPERLDLRTTDLEEARVRMGWSSDEWTAWHKERTLVRPKGS